MTKSELQENFRNRFHKDATDFFFCPGRVNLIGEHIDYNGGKVMPCAISRGTFLAIAKNTDKKLRLQCLNFPETAELHLQTSYAKTGKEWFNYPLGSLNQLLQEGHTISGLDMLFYGNLPIGAGLSSSASIEVLTMFAANELFQLDISNIEIAKLGKKVENEFIGLNSGIMDQFAVAMGRKNKAILLNCDSLEYEYLPFEIGDYVLAIINSNKPRTLADSKYNERFRECGAALKLLKKELTVTHLCDIDSSTFHTHKHLINDAVLEKRALHVITENERVKEAKNALQLNQLDRFGELMYASHQSLQELYEVSGKELDTIVEFCKTHDGCIGARMTGAGFGGCAIALVKKDSFNDFSKKLVSYYKEKIGYEPEVFASVIGDGVKSI
ncbi:galactokinase [Terrimonas pollutisoli]|uniref:galactokinase n=1 Tax=Terrimonas pollutisoli TaxID=3034147 RepID=UPI0023EDA825|nr:galactokinase [Terrimonas sp. H1YJ31]